MSLRCRKCKRPIRSKKYRLCFACRRLTYDRDRRKRAHKEGTCEKCPKKAYKGRMCRKHYARHKERVNARYRKTSKTTRKNRCSYCTDLGVKGRAALGHNKLTCPNRKR